MNDEYINTPLGFSFVRGRKKIDFDYKVHIPAYAREFQWTTEPPTKEGWYWVFLHEKVQIVEVGKHDDGGLVYWESGILYNHRDLSFVDFWLGPLPVPEPPTEGE